MDKLGVPLQGAYTTAAVRELVGSWRLTHQTVALVPTMGDLHRGHLSLMKIAREHADRVICSIFVNPMQFGVGEDFASYPRSLAEDESLLAEQGLVDLVFAPDEKDIYPYGLEAAVKVSVPQLSNELCAANRPRAFRGSGFGGVAVARHRCPGRDGARGEGLSATGVASPPGQGSPVTDPGGWRIHPAGTGRGSR